MYAPERVMHGKMPLAPNGIVGCKRTINTLKTPWANYTLLNLLDLRTY